jgi:hypothetical protein
MRQRYIVTEIAVTPLDGPKHRRKAVWDRKLQRVVDSFVPGEEFRAQGVADQLNHEAEYGDATPQLIADMERDGLL